MKTSYLQAMTLELIAATVYQEYNNGFCGLISAPSFENDTNLAIVISLAPFYFQKTNTPEMNDFINKYYDNENFDVDVFINDLKKLTSA